MKENGECLTDQSGFVQRWQVTDSAIIPNNSNPVSRTGTTGELLYRMYRMVTVLAVKILSNCLPSKYYWTQPKACGKNREELLEKTSSTKDTPTGDSSDHWPLRHIKDESEKSQAAAMK